MPCQIFPTIRFIFTFLFTASLAIISILIALKYENAECQSTYKVVSLTDWLIINGIAMFVLTVVLNSIALAYAIKDRLLLKLLTLLFSVVQLLYIIIWTITGSLELFENTDCTKKPQLWFIVLANLIVHWLSFFSICCCFICH